MSDFNDDFNPPPAATRTPSQPSPRPIAKIAEALAKAQGEMVQPEKNKTVTVRPKDSAPYSFDYADYNAIVEAVRGPLSKNQICFTHLVELLGDDLVLMTRLIHASGEYLESLYPLKVSTDAKALGGAMTYGKRYCLSALTGCVADDDADAEPENVTAFGPKQPAAPKPSPIAPKAQGPAAPPPEEKKPAYTGPSAGQIARLFAIAGERHWTNTEVKTYMQSTWKIDSTKGLTREQYDGLIATMQSKTFLEALPAAGGPKQ